MNVPEKHRAVAHAWVDGAEVEYKTYTDVNWHTTATPDWHENSEYRIKLTKPSINWSHVHPQYTYMAMDITGRTWLYHKQPSCGGGEWEHPCNPSFPTVKAETFASFKIGTCDWGDSLVARPQGE